jgi:hypothetical protein
MTLMCPNIMLKIFYVSSLMGFEMPNCPCKKIFKAVFAVFSCVNLVSLSTSVTCKHGGFMRLTAICWLQVKFAFCGTDVCLSLLQWWT